MTFLKRVSETGISILAGGALAVCFMFAATKTFEFIVDKIGEHVTSSQEPSQIESGLKKELYNKQYTP